MEKRVKTQDNFLRTWWAHMRAIVYRTESTSPYPNLNNFKVQIPPKSAKKHRSFWVFSHPCENGEFPLPATTSERRRRSDAQFRQTWGQNETDGRWVTDDDLFGGFLSDLMDSPLCNLVKLFQETWIYTEGLTEEGGGLCSLSRAMFKEDCSKFAFLRRLTEGNSGAWDEA